jgi:peroxiredoxin Q/BCP
VSFDDPEAQRRFAEKFSFPFALLPDVDRTIGMAYGACDTPRDEYATRIAYLIGKDGRVLEAHSQVSPASYPAEQLESLRRIAASS